MSHSPALQDLPKPWRAAPDLQRLRDAWRELTGNSFTARTRAGRLMFVHVDAFTATAHIDPISRRIRHGTRAPMPCLPVGLYRVYCGRLPETVNAGSFVAYANGADSLPGQ